ncbi:MAG TPA: DUF5985 family protein [Vicinamibacterales bacterium]|nr:DUF5985 family protein [Vicinamibacterales bacterium]
MGSVIYALCALTSLACAALLLRGYARHGERLLLLAGVCFCGLALNNLLVFSDFVVVPDVDLSLYRNLAAAASVLLFLLGLIWHTGDRG